MNEKLRSGLKLGGIALVSAVLLEVCTLIGAHGTSLLNLQDWRPARMALFFLAVFLVLAFRFWYWGKKPLLKGVVDDLVQTIKRRRPLGIGLSLGAGVAVFVIGSFALIHHGSAVSFSVGFAAMAALPVTALGLFWGAHGDHPEFLFLAIVLGGGLYFAIALPPETLMSWDDEIHYKNALGVSYVVDAQASDAEGSIFTPQDVSWLEEVGRPMSDGGTAQWGISWTQEELDAYVSNMDDAVAAQGYSAIKESVSTVGYASFAYLPSALGLWLARLLHLPFTAMFVLGRLFNMLVYAFVCFAAIRVVPRRKVLLAAIALLPTSVFIASSYSYDPWLTCWTMLAVALVIREMCSPDEIDFKRVIAIIVALFLGLGPKAIYFTLFGLLFLIPKRRFSSKRSRRVFIVVVCVAALLVLLSFALPFVVSSGGGGDMRGSTNVSPSGQIAFMLQHPLFTMKTFANFVMNQYLSVPSSEYMLSFAYLSSSSRFLPFLGSLPLVLVIVTALTDSFEEEPLCGWGGRIWVFAIFVVTVILIVLALYISYNAVGSATVEGVQGRYLLPLLFPVFAIGLSFPIVNHLDRNGYSTFVLGSSYVILFVSILTVVVLRVLA